ncbi:MAG: universal stress protein UspA [Candidatus Roseilinea sp.]|nr:MAG: universal stress protein UspA [Candidatus Roseilinea sp.]
MFEHILVPLDRSALAECVLPHVSAIARAFGSHVTLLHIIDAPRFTEATPLVNPLEWRLKRAEAQCYLSDIARRLESEGISVASRLAEGPPAEQILDVARHEGADLIICSSHGRSGLSEWNVSSVVQKVALRAYTSLMIVRAHQATQNPLTLAMDVPYYKRVLVPMDGSQRAEYVMPVIARLALQGSHILLAHVVQRPEMPRRTPLTRADSELSERYVACNRSEAENYMRDLRARLSGDVETRVIVGDHVGRTLHELAEHEDVDLVVVSAHGYSGQSLWPFGSIASSFIAFGNRTLLIVQDAQPPAERLFRPAATAASPVRSIFGFRGEKAF